MNDFFCLKSSFKHSKNNQLKGISIVLSRYESIDLANEWLKLLEIKDILSVTNFVHKFAQNNLFNKYTIFSIQKVS